MRTISQRELRNGSAAVMDSVEAGEVYRITRNGVEVAELRPVARRRPVTARELVARHRHFPHVDHVGMRAEAEAFFGTDDRIDDDEPASGGRG